MAIFFHCKSCNEDVSMDDMPAHNVAYHPRELMLSIMVRLEVLENEVKRAHEAAQAAAEKHQSYDPEGT